MNNRIVDAAAPKGTFTQEAILMFLVFTEQIGRQRFFPLFDKPQGFAEMGIGENRQNRAENFFLH